MELKALARGLAAFAHPVRLQVLCELAGEAGGLPAGELAKRIIIRQNTLSAHIAALRRQGLVFGHRQGRQIIYRLDAVVARRVLTSAVTICRKQRSPG